MKKLFFIQKKKNSKQNESIKNIHTTGIDVAKGLPNYVPKGQIALQDQ